MKRRAADTLFLAVVCLVLHWHSFQSWFRGDDFSWMALQLTIHGPRDLLHALFAPMAQGTIRPLGERGLLLAGYALFGLHSLPMRLVIFATQIAALGLAAGIGDRLSGVRGAGVCAGLLWMLNSTTVDALGWVSVYNQVACAFFLLLAFHFLLRYIETGQTRYYRYQWVVFLLGFGAMEVTLVYPALAAAYAFLCAPKFLRRTLPLFVPSLIYVVVHEVLRAGVADHNPDYAMHFTGAVLRTFATYWMWSVGPVFSWSPTPMPAWLIPAGVVILTLALLGFAATRRAGIFALAWFVITLAPVLPLRDHLTEYYPYIPVIGLSWLGGWALVATFRSGRPTMLIALALGVLYVLMMAPRTLAAEQWNARLTERVRRLVDGLGRAGSLHPNKTLLLDGVDSELFWNGVLDHPHRLLGIERLYLTPGSQRLIPAQADLGNVNEFVLSGELTAQVLARQEAVVLDARDPGLRDITATYQVPVDAGGLPHLIDVANPLAAKLLGPEWYAAEGNHRWMGKAATVRIAGPTAPGQKLYLRGTCPEGQLKTGALAVTVRIDGVHLPSASIAPGQNDFELSFALPPATVGRPAIEVSVSVARTFHAGADQRDLGLAFGTVEVR